MVVNKSPETAYLRRRRICCVSILAQLQRLEVLFSGFIGPLCKIVQIAELVVRNRQVVNNLKMETSSLISVEETPEQIPAWYSHYDKREGAGGQI